MRVQEQVKTLQKRKREFRHVEYCRINTYQAIQNEKKQILRYATGISIRGEQRLMMRSGRGKQVKGKASRYSSIQMRGAGVDTDQQLIGPNSPSRLQSTQIATPPEAQI